MRRLLTTISTCPERPPAVQHNALFYLLFKVIGQCGHGGQSSLEIAGASLAGGTKIVIVGEINAYPQRPNCPKCSMFQRFLAQIVDNSIGDCSPNGHEAFKNKDCSTNS